MGVTDVEPTQLASSKVSEDSSAGQGVIHLPGHGPSVPVRAVARDIFNRPQMRQAVTRYDYNSWVLPTCLMRKRDP